MKPNTSTYIPSPTIPIPESENPWGDDGAKGSWIPFNKDYKESF